MTEQKLQFRVGLFVILAVVGAAVMIFEFGELQSFWEPKYALAIHFEAAPGVYPSTPVQRNGINIGSVSDVVLDDKKGGVVVVAEINEHYRLRADAQPRLQVSLLGDATIDFTPGKSRTFLAHGDRLEGEPPTDPLQIVNHLDRKLTTTLDAFHATSQEWQQVGRNINNLLETNEGNLNLVIEQTATALKHFTVTMQNADNAIGQVQSLVGDPRNQENLRKTLAALPELVEETRQAVSAVRLAVKQADATLHSINQATSPLANRSASIVSRLDGTLGNLQSLSAELNEFSQLVNTEDGSLQRFVADPELYRNLNRSAASLAVLLKNVEPVVRDLRIFSDKIARHPELMGVGGALRGSSGLKDPADDADSRRAASPTKRRPNRR